MSSEVKRISARRYRIVEEGTYADGRWVPGRRLNADENDQGKFWRFSPQGVEIEKVNIYRFE